MEQESPYRPPAASPILPRDLTAPDTEEPAGNPWFSIWTRPRATIRGILREDPTKQVHLLAILSGISNTLDRALQQGAAFSTAALVAGVVLGGVVAGLLQLYLGGALLALTGDWLGGEADAEEVRATIAWSHVPVVPALALTLLLVAAFGAGAYASQDFTAAASLALLLVGGATVGLAIWALVLQVVCLAEVQRFSIWKAIASILLAALVILVPLGFIVALFSFTS